MLSEIHYPWKALIDGQPVPLYRADYALRSIPVPAGRHTVAYRYDDGAFRRGSIISFVSLCAVIGITSAGVVSGRREKRPASTPPQQ